MNAVAARRPSWRDVQPEVVGTMGRLLTILRERNDGVIVLPRSDVPKDQRVTLWSGGSSLGVHPLLKRNGAMTSIGGLFPSARLEGVYLHTGQRAGLSLVGSLNGHNYTGLAAAPGSLATLLRYNHRWLLPALTQLAASLGVSVQPERDRAAS